MGRHPPTRRSPADQGLNAWPGRVADPDQQQAMPAAQVNEGSLGPARDQHRGPSRQDRIQPGLRASTIDCK
jgi:hypothetical protein